MSLIIWLLIEGSFVSRTISGAMSLLITSVASNVGRISSKFILSFVMMVLPFFVILILLLSMISSSANCEILIFSFSHILFSCYKMWLVLCTLFFECAEIDYPSSRTYSLNEWIPWSRDTIQGGHYNLCILNFFIHCFKLFFDPGDLCEVWLYGLRILDLHILQPVPQSHLPVYVLSFKQFG